MPFDTTEVLRRYREFEGMLREGDQAPTITLGDIRITQTGARGRHIDLHYMRRVGEALKELLDLAEITPSFREYIERNVMVSYNMGLPPDSVLQALPADPERGDFGFFDPVQAEECERNWYASAVNAELSPQGRSLVKKWERDLGQKYPKK